MTHTEMELVLNHLRMAIQNALILIPGAFFSDVSPGGRSANGALRLSVPWSV